MKCELCKRKIGTTFLNKILGTVVKDAKGRKHYVCSDCQKKSENEKDKMLAGLDKK